MIKGRVLAPNLWADLQAQNSPYQKDREAGTHPACSRQALNLGRAEPVGKGLGDCGLACLAGEGGTASWAMRDLLADSQAEYVSGARG